MGSGVRELLQFPVRTGKLVGCLFENTLGALALRNVTDRAADQQPFLGLQGAEANLNGELLAISAQSKQLAAPPHRASLGVGQELLSMALMLRAQSLGEQYFHRLL